MSTIASPSARPTTARPTTAGSGVVPRCGCPFCGGSRFQDQVFSAGRPVAGGPSPVANSAYYVSALLPQGNPTWTGAVGQPAQISYSFMESFPAYLSGQGANGFAPMGDPLRTAVRTALQAWADVANVTFSETTDSDTGVMLRFGTNYQGQSAGYAYYPNSHPAGGDVFIANNYDYNVNPQPGGYGPLVVVHEIGHALGLKHPGNYNAGSSGGTEGPYLPGGEDSHRFTVMSYHAYNGHGAIPDAPMLYDVAALQFLYGANSRTRTGDDTYSFEPDQPAVTTVWDAGGTDTMDCGALTTSVIVQLREGQFSSIGRGPRGGPALNNVSVAFGTTLENAIGGSGHDLLVGNQEANMLTGGAGGDILNGQGGDDVLEGGIGRDTLRGGAGADQMSGGAGNDYYLVQQSDDVVVEMSGEGTDEVESQVTFILPDAVEILRLIGTVAIDGTGNGDSNTIFGNAASNLLTGGDGGDTLMGGAGRDSLVGDGGDDVLRGGRGQDFMFGGEGEDRLWGGAAHDEMTGGSGADSFVYRPGDGRDLIVDFTPGDGDRILLATGMRYTAQAAPDGIFLQFNGEDRLRLKGLTVGQVSTDWFQFV